MLASKNLSEARPGHQSPRPFCVLQNMKESQQSELFHPNIDNLTENNAFCGFVHSIERALQIVKEYELKTTTKFTVYKRSKDFGFFWILSLQV